MRHGRRGWRGDQTCLEDPHAGLEPGNTRGRGQGLGKGGVRDEEQRVECGGHSCVVVVGDGGPAGSVGKACTKGTSLTGAGDTEKGYMEKGDGREGRRLEDGGPARRVGKACMKGDWGQRCSRRMEGRPEVSGRPARSARAGGEGVVVVGGNEIWGREGGEAKGVRRIRSQRKCRRGEGAYVCVGEGGGGGG